MPKKLIEVSKARRLVLERVGPPTAEPVPLRPALGRVLAADIASSDAVPGFNNSSMDGFAVRAADTKGAAAGAPVALRVAGESRAGRPARSALDEGQAIAISTGAVVPAGADAVVRVEDTSTRDGRVEVSASVEPGNNVRCAGDDIQPGETVLRRGTTIGAAELGVLASVGVGEVSCARRPRIWVLTTGDELLEPDDAMRPGGVRNSNAYTVPSVALGAGAEVVAVETVRDDPAATRPAIGRALDADIAVISGGVSVGEHDHVKPALEALGVERVFWRVALKPGKPTWFGIGPAGQLVFGLPGNPVSTMVTFLLFVRPAHPGDAGSGRHGRDGGRDPRRRPAEAAGTRPRGALLAGAPRGRLARAPHWRSGFPRPHLDARRRRARDRAHRRGPPGCG